ncbi:MAG TPA: protein-L-isoaspartate O-methyltransferase [Beijerinckiaceae bacterium]|jgi:protein-L-isoaspartate(D-aspartate) O-methyltransferase
MTVLSAALDEAPPHRVEAAAFILALRARNIRDTAVLRAMECVSRELFAPRRFADLARRDVALPLPCGQTMTSPATVAAMLAALEARPGQRVLEVGTGSGYVTALLAHLGGQVHTFERYATLAESAVERLRIAGLGGSVTADVGDGLVPGLPGGGFERILLNGALAAVPATVTTLLAAGGRLVGAITVEGSPRLIRIERQPYNKLKQEVGARLRLAPLVTGPAASL